ncbi:MAG TPA: hypothetical protein VFM75_11410 [Modicisalibacter sp.]|nr:hypothetical protein [Modicisalibacter sp.]
MKIIGGSFGNSGSAFVSRDKLCIEGARKADYSRAQLDSVQSRTEKGRRFHWFTAILGAVILGFALSLFLGVLGVIAGIALAIAGSFHADKRNIVEIALADGNRVTLDCTPRGVKKLINLSPP